MWTSDKIRSTFLQYFADKNHTVVESSSLVPINDPTLLFTNAGMNQFKDVFLGIDRRNYSRATTSQKCVRAGGKHNDLDTVGRTARHHTFFEMLGNFSFGDYFKRDAIQYAWEFLTEVVALPKSRLWVTIYLDDDAALQLWQETTDVNPERILKMDEKDNFWSMGDTGPCGPCSEIHYDRGEEHACGPDCALGVCDCDRWLEVWNLVFMQYNRDENGVLTPLPRPSIDTGMGLERLASLLQGVNSNFDTDLFIPLIKQIEKLSGQKYHQGEKGFPFRVIADHSRTCTFLIADGVLPSNDGRGYVLRRILRRALRFGRLLGINEAFLYKNVDVVCSIMGKAYPELMEKSDFIKEVIKMEEERFLLTLNEGLKKVEDILAQVQEQGKTEIGGEEAFMLYDTYGFPLDLTEDVAEEKGFTVNKDGFNRMMEEQRQRAREAGKGENAFARDIVIAELLNDIKPSDFSGYEKLKDTSALQAIIQDGKLHKSVTNKEVLLVTASTPFYAESGGQVADSGIITGKSGKMQVTDVQKLSYWIIHRGILEGSFKVGEKLQLEVNQEQRTATARNHTATHLLHRALRQVLGEHAQQKGSLVEPSRLRFDFSHLAALDEAQLIAIENIVNQAIWSMYQVNTTVTDITQAREMGAIALFGEKYGDEVRVVQVQDFSQELCGGTHVKNTGQIGLFKITSEGSIGSGLRRIEALTSSYALAYLNQAETELKSIAAALKTSPGDLSHKVESLSRSLKEKDKEIEHLKGRLSRAASGNLLEKAYQINEVQVLIEMVEGVDANSLRQNGEMLRDKLGTSVVMLASVIEDKVALVCFVSKDLTAKGFHAGKIVGAAAKAAGGGGGGRPDMAQAGARDASKIEEALAAARQMIEKSFS
ncbi:MAG: alanine--tRNA ligase [Syntrophomonadaceae bacterium]|nr:alanine--tRNA ligase [Syntrophomonadaceae bacterium]